MTSVFMDSDLCDDARRRRLYNGDIFLFGPSPSSLELVDLARRMLEEAFAPFDPRDVHKHKSAEEVAAILAQLKPAFIHHPECKRLLPTIMAERGMDLDRLYFDVPRLRSSYPKSFLSSGIAYAYHPHRDTWYSAPHCQLNWWLPIYSVDPDNGMSFYPRHFSEGVANTSENYNYYEWNTQGRPSAAQHVRCDTREQPKPRGPVSTVRLRYIPPVGGVVLFSGAQLHDTVENTTDLARYSIDFRTVHLDDLRERRGAPNVDSRCTGTTARDFFRASDLAGLPDDLIALYDDETAQTDQVLCFGDRHAPGRTP